MTYPSLILDIPKQKLRGNLRSDEFNNKCLLANPTRGREYFSTFATCNPNPVITLSMELESSMIDR
jgi:hypothetical protein